MAGRADLILQGPFSPQVLTIFPRPGSHPQNAASGLYIALVIQIPAVTSLDRGGICHERQEQRRIQARVVVGFHKITRVSLYLNTKLRICSN